MRAEMSHGLVKECVETFSLRDRAEKAQNCVGHVVKLSSFLEVRTAENKIKWMNGEQRGRTIRRREIGKYDGRQKGRLPPDN